VGSHDGKLGDRWVALEPIGKGSSATYGSYGPEIALEPHGNQTLADEVPRALTTRMAQLSRPLVQETGTATRAPKRSCSKYGNPCKENVETGVHLPPGI